MVEPSDAGWRDRARRYDNRAVFFVGTPADVADLPVWPRAALPPPTRDSSVRVRGRTTVPPPIPVPVIEALVREALFILTQAREQVPHALRAMICDELPQKIVVRDGPKQSKVDGCTVHRAWLGRNDESDALPTAGAFGPKFKGDFFANFRKSQRFKDSQEHYKPGWTANDLFADPKLTQLSPDWRVPLDARRPQRAGHRARDVRSKARERTGFRARISRSGREYRKELTRAPNRWAIGRLGNAQVRR